MTHSFQHATAAHAHGVRPHCRFPTADTRINFILPETRVPELHDSCYSISIGLSVFSFTLLFSKAKKDVQDERYRVTPLSFNVFFLKNPTEYPHTPYIARN